jgi:hypothetical protein
MKAMPDPVLLNSYKTRLKNYRIQIFITNSPGKSCRKCSVLCIGKRGDVVPGNSFRYHKGHIEFRKAHAIDCTIDEAFDINDLHPFKETSTLKNWKKFIKVILKKIFLSVNYNYL